MRIIFEKFWTAFSFAFVLTAPCIVKNLSAQDIVNTENGKLQGITEDGITYFKGIPYAAPPVGNLRWRPPQPAASWAGIRSAGQFGNDCMQWPIASEAKLYIGATLSEDCLFMNVWRPANKTEHALPVMVWIYGGGFVNGGTSMAVWGGTEFARGGVIMVSFNYRLGRFGFFAHPALTREDPDGLLGNYGYMDQIAALKWVQRNIVAFGGDPHNVTIFGESAGGISVHALITSPLTHGLFQKAIIESGTGRKSGIGDTNWPPTSPATTSNMQTAEAIGLAFANSKGISGEDAEALEKLRGLPAETIVDGLNMATMRNQSATYGGPMIDGKVVTEDPQIAYVAGKQPRIPVIVGANSAEVGVTLRIPRIATSFDQLFAPFGAHTSAARKAYAPGQAEDLDAVTNCVRSDASMVEPARFAARAMSNTGQPVWEYRFSYVADSMRKTWTGAPHNTELPYVFNDLNAFIDFDTLSLRRDLNFTSEDEKMAQTMHAYWLQFAKTGNPNGPGLPNWPQYSQQTDVLMNFTNAGPVAQPDSSKERLDLIEAIQ